MTASNEPRVSDEDREAAIRNVSRAIHPAYGQATLRKAEIAVDTLVSDGWGPKPTVDGRKLRGRLDQLWGWAKSGKQARDPDGGEYYLMDVENVDGPEGFTEFVLRWLRECGIEVTQ